MKDIMPAEKIAVKPAAVQGNRPKTLSFVVPHVSIHKVIVTL
jgi:hypothetical protein